jgi:hypothetical protein
MRTCSNNGGGAEMLLRQCRLMKRLSQPGGRSYQNRCTRILSRLFYVSQANRIVFIPVHASSAGMDANHCLSKQAIYCRIKSGETVSSLLLCRFAAAQAALLSSSRLEWTLTIARATAMQRDSHPGRLCLLHVRR